MNSFFKLFNITQFRETALYDWLIVGQLGLDWQTFEKPMDFIHKRGGEYVVWALIGIHVAAALFHHFVKKDNVLRRMAPAKLK